MLEESARIALSWVRGHAQALPAPSSAGGGGAGGGASLADDPTGWDVHVHLPAGAVPKVPARPPAPAAAGERALLPGHELESRCGRLWDSASTWRKSTLLL